jgi:protein-L-isoaspartate(D-aspartate) O-methyltransferase
MGTVRPLCRRLDRRSFAAGAAALVLPNRAPAQGEESAYASERERMVDVIQDHARHAEPALGRSEIEERVLEVMGKVRRHEFVPEGQRDQAYDDRPLPIGYGQTISQPFIVALMTDMLRVGPEAKVLEIGTGSGYQAAVLAHLVEAVHTVEIIPELAQAAKGRLARLGYDTVTVHTGDGYYGLPDAAPFDGIVVTAAAGQVPPPLIAQLAPGSRMVIPVGPPFMLQYLMLVEKDVGGQVRTRQTLPVAFVPLTRGP